MKDHSGELYVSTAVAKSTAHTFFMVLTPISAVFTVLNAIWVLQVTNSC